MQRMFAKHSKALTCYAHVPCQLVRWRSLISYVQCNPPCPEQPGTNTGLLIKLTPKGVVFSFLDCTCAVHPGQHGALQVTQHGACLGLGLAGLGSGDDEVFEDLKNVLYLDSAVAGEAAGLALGLLHVGTATEKATEMLAYAHDTQHEKVRSPHQPHCANNLTAVCSESGNMLCIPLPWSVMFDTSTLQWSRMLVAECHPGSSGGCRSSVALPWVWL